MDCILKQCKNKQRGSGYCKQHYHAHVFLKKRPLYNTWCNIKRRCRDTKHPRYQDWGGRGIGMCDIWFYDYFKFAIDVGPKPSPFHQLDRINNNGAYEIGNCRWTTATIQARNRRTKKTSKTGITGVELRPEQGYVSSITVNKKKIYLGTFRDLSTAIKARKVAEEIYF